MKLVTFAHRGVQRVGLLEGEHVIDVNRAYASLLAQRGDLRAGPMAEALVPADMIGILEAGERALTAIHEGAGYVRDGLGSAEQTAELKRGGVVVTLSEVTLKAPLPRPGKLILLGLNYRDHAE